MMRYVATFVDRFHGRDPSSTCVVELSEIGLSTFECKTVARMLREAKLLPPGQRVAEVRPTSWSSHGVESVVVFPLKAMHRTGTHSITLTRIPEDTLVGYDGVTYAIGDRVELRPGLYEWLRDARFGTVVGTSLTKNDRVHVKLDSMPNSTFGGPDLSFRKVRS